LHATECSAIAIAAHEPRTSSNSRERQQRDEEEEKKRFNECVVCSWMRVFGVGNCWMIVTTAYLIDK
jgi:hypothetical protein